VQRPTRSRHLFYLGEIGGIPSKGAYPPRSKAANLPFNGATFIPVAFVRSALCLTETYGAERDSHMQNQVLVPALTARLDVEVAEKKKTIAEHEVRVAHKKHRGLAQKEKVPARKIKMHGLPTEGSILRRLFMLR